MFNQFPENTSSVNHFLAFIKEHQITDYNGYILFHLTNMEKNFYQNLEFLKGKDIWTSAELTDYTLIAQTIDNDYILATDTSVLVIPNSLNKKDSETFNMTINHFFISFEDKKLVSRILSVN